MSEKNGSSNKKPVYKKWWFWAIVILIMAVIGSAGSDNNSNTDSENVVNESSNNTMSVAKCESDDMVEMIDLSAMGANDIAKWVSDNGFSYKVGAASYSDTIEREALLSQSIKAGEKVCKGSELTVTYSLGKEPSTEYKNALAKAKNIF